MSSPLLLLPLLLLEELLWPEVPVDLDEVLPADFVLRPLDAVDDAVVSPADLRDREEVLPSLPDELPELLPVAELAVFFEVDELREVPVVLLPAPVLPLAERPLAPELLSDEPEPVDPELPELPMLPLIPLLLPELLPDPLRPDELPELDPEFPDPDIDPDDWLV